MISEKPKHNNRATYGGHLSTIKARVITLTDLPCARCVCVCVCVCLRTYVSACVCVCVRAGRRQHCRCSRIKYRGGIFVRCRVSLRVIANKCCGWGGPECRQNWSTDVQTAITIFESSTVKCINRKKRKTMEIHSFYLPLVFCCISTRAPGF